MALKREFRILRSRYRALLSRQLIIPRRPSGRKVFLSRSSDVGIGRSP
jgi:hypothetical protein